VAAQLYFDAADLLEDVRQGFVVLHFTEANADVVLYAIRLETCGEPAGVIRFACRCRLEIDEWPCRVELRPDTLTGIAQIGEE
jgi:hypothetical protein